MIFIAGHVSHFQPMTSSTFLMMIKLNLCSQLRTRYLASRFIVAEICPAAN